MEFTTDFVGTNADNWAQWLSKFKGLPIHALEIGSWEGRSATWFLRNILTHPESTLTCVDTFYAGQDLPEFTDDTLFDRFRANIAEWKEKVIIERGKSSLVLPRLLCAKRQFDFAYIDGSHLAADVLRDAMYTFDMCRNGAVMIFDDFEWGRQFAVKERPDTGILGFIHAFEDHFRLIARQYQFAIEVIKPCTDTTP